MNKKTKLLSTNQDTDDGRYCPKCGADWRADQIPIEWVAQGYYGHDAPCQKKQKWDDNFDESVPCICPPKYFSHLIGIEIRGKYDGVSEWMCPACSTRWDRWTRNEVEGDNG